jgi:hypothetical protein
MNDRGAALGGADSTEGWTSMKLLYAFLALGLLLVAPATASALPKPMPAEKNDYCQDEAIRWVKSRFGEDTKILGSRIDKSALSAPPRTSSVSTDTTFATNSRASSAGACTDVASAERCSTIGHWSAGCRSLVIHS